ncbi:MAG TPA: DUF3072 domain-containing protein [Candidatus Limnocylindria bacterium]|nr:DUF3072 domain-containing protein [Candidatus Limnocylindria bacterium]
METLFERGFTKLEREPDDWKTGGEPMTEAQASYLRTLSDEVGEPFDGSLTKAQASERIDAPRARDRRLQGQRGASNLAPDDPGERRRAS